MSDPSTDVLDKPVANLGHLSTRVRWVFLNHQIDTIRHLVNRTEKELLKLGNFGQSSLIEVKQLLYIHGLHLRSPDSPDGTLPLVFPSVHDRLLRIEQRLDAIENKHALRVVGDMASFRVSGGVSQANVSHESTDQS